LQNILFTTSLGQVYRKDDRTELPDAITVVCNGIYFFFYLKTTILRSILGLCYHSLVVPEIRTTLLSWDYCFQNWVQVWLSASVVHVGQGSSHQVNGKGIQAAEPKSGSLV